VASKYSLIEECRRADSEYGGRSHHQEKMKVQNNLLKIDVYFENLRVKSVEQSPTYKVCRHGFTYIVCSLLSSFVNKTYDSFLKLLLL
jgi:hypothetical protein